MAGRDEMEHWYWQDESFKLDSESPLAISTSFWEELTRSEGNSHPLYASAPPVVDTRIQPSNPSFYPYPLDSQGSDSHGSSSSEYSHQNGERYKRRRMLHFSGARTDGTAPGSPPYVNVISSPTAIHSTYGSCTPPLVSTSEEYMLQVPCGSPGSPTSLWFPRNDDATTSVLANAQQPGDKWTLRPFGENEAYSAHEQMKAPVLPYNDFNTSVLGGSFLQQPWHQHMQHTQHSQLLQDARQSQHSQHRHQPQQSGEVEVLQGPLTPFSKPPIPGRKLSTGPSRFKVKSSTPVALPFALLKPSAAQGDVTLNDINQRLLSPPPRPLQRPFPTDEEKPPAQSGAGLSGKSVVACTKIHTQGNGTITIMRTRG